MLDEADARSQRAMDAILAYLARSPQAADTEQGIAQWWLADMGGDVPIEDVRRALARLLELKAIVRAQLPDGRVIYGGAVGHRPDV